jgi:rRNA maturation endonuclease Nob1
MYTIQNVALYFSLYFMQSTNKNEIFNHVKRDTTVKRSHTHMHV